MFGEVISGVTTVISYLRVFVQVQTLRTDTVTARTC